MTRGPTTLPGPCPISGGSALISSVNDPAAEKLAERLSGLPSMRFANDPEDREFDTVSDMFVAQTKPANFTLNKKFRGQARATFEKAIISGWVPYFHFEGESGPGVLRVIERYGKEYGVTPVVDLDPLGG